MGHTGFDPGAVSDAVANAKAALEALLHPHGPPIVSSTRVATAAEPMPSNAEIRAYMPPVQSSSPALGSEHLQEHGLGQVAEVASGLQNETQMLSSEGLLQEKIQPSGVAHVTDSKLQDGQAKEAPAVGKEREAVENRAPVQSEVRANEIASLSGASVRGNEDVVMVPQDESCGADDHEKSIAENPDEPVRAQENVDDDANGNPVEIGLQGGGDDILDDDEEEVLQSLRFEASDED